MESPPLLPLVRKYFENDPLTAAHSLEALPQEDAVAVLRELPGELTARAFPYLTARHAAALLAGLPSAEFGAIVQKLEPEQGAAIFIHLRADTREQFLAHLPERGRRRLQELLTYPEGSAGRIMSTEVLAFHTDLNVKDTIGKIRALARSKAPASYAYVVDAQDRLVGVINMRDLMLAPEDAALAAVMRRNVFTVNVFMDREQVVEELSKRRFFAAPVVDQDNRLLGIVRAEQLLQDAQQEATEDIQKMFGAGGDERPFSPIRFSVAKRLPWLYVNLGTAFLAAFVVSFFQDVIARITVLAVFLPVVAGQGGNAGAQSLAVVMRGLVMREIPRDRIARLLAKEASLGVLTGLATGVATALGAWLWLGSPFLGVVAGLAMIVTLVAAAFAGAAIPITMKAVGLDPAQCSNIILTTVTDVVGISSFLGFAVLFQHHLS